LAASIAVPGLDVEDDAGAARGERPDCHAGLGEHVGVLLVHCARGDRPIDAGLVEELRDGCERVGRAPDVRPGPADGEDAIDSDALPGVPTAPTSICVHGSRRRATVTLVNVDVVVTDRL
jgi:hypothetical protein